MIFKQMLNKKLNIVFWMLLWKTNSQFLSDYPDYALLKNIKMFSNHLFICSGVLTRNFENNCKPSMAVSYLITRICLNLEKNNSTLTSTVWVNKLPFRIPWRGGNKILRFQLTPYGLQENSSEGNSGFGLWIGSVWSQWLCWAATSESWAACSGLTQNLLLETGVRSKKRKQINVDW